MKGKVFFYERLFDNSKNNGSIHLATKSRESMCLIVRCRAETVCFLQYFVSCVCGATKN